MPGIPFLSRNSLRVRLAATLFLGFIVLLGFASVLIYFVAKNILEEDFDARLFAKAQAAIASISQKGTDLDVDWNELPQELHSQRNSLNAIQLIDSKGQPFFNDSILSIKLRQAPPPGIYRDYDIPKLGPVRVFTLSFVPRVEEEDVAVTPVDLRKECILAVSVDRSSLEHSLHKLIVILAFTTAGISFLSLILVSLVLQRGLSTLDDLGAAVARINADTLGQRIATTDWPRELEPIVGKLNDLLDRLDISFARERRFSADVSHELRTPVTELRTLSEVMLQESDYSPEVQQAFKDTREIALQMESLVTVLLEMVRQEASGTSPHLSEIDLELQARSTWKRYEEKAAAWKIQLQVASPDKTIWVRTEQRLFSMILSNLFANAIEYSPVGSSIGLELRADAGSPCLVISNPAPNLTPADLPHLFERFWRKDKARAESGHFGLGLSLTQTLCQRIGIQLNASMAEKNHIRFRLCFPAPDPSDKNK